MRLVLPHHLRNLAGVAGELVIEVGVEVAGEVAVESDATALGEVSLAAVLDALESRFPALRGTIRDQATGRRRPFVRFFACRRDLSHEPMTASLPREVVEGNETLIVLGAMAGG